MANQLTASSGSGTQSATQSPQTAGQPSTAAAQTSNVQPGTATDLLRSQSGVQLQDTALSTVSLSTQTTSSSTTSAAPATQQPKHHVNAVLFALPVLLVLLAVIFFWLTSRSVKSTTE